MLKSIDSPNENIYKIRNPTKKKISMVNMDISLPDMLQLSECAVS